MSSKSPEKESCSEEPKCADLPEAERENPSKEVLTSIKAPKDGANTAAYDFVSHPWKSCWDSNYHCYYYWNTETNETTYTFPGSESARGSEAGSHQAESGASAQTSSIAQYPNNAYYPQDPSQYYYPQQAGAPINYYPNYAELYNAPAPVQHSTEDPEYSDFIRKEYGETTITSEGKIGGMFNAKTGNFQSDHTINPDKFSQYNKAVRQCNAFFDYDGFAEQRGLEYMAYYNGLTPNPRHQKLPKKVFEKLKTLKKEKKLESKKKWLRD
ncbi:hypothetical protein DSO57_1026548 [Entomophthora muscae]|uniref:Uncharacterized protein n=1 Tax=Entomophthora muscae TaxID=34485 RepID=A0ACC2SQY9_9FUNG|nr:hypothetical protein DSO57_1026548 [Entomophthora muscae]